MARGGHGGARQGAPGKSYDNRTDLNVARAPQTGTQTAAAGGVQAPAAVAAQQPTQVPPPPGISPSAVPGLDDPSARPAEPLTAGLPFGPGAGPGQDPNREDLLAMKRHLPFLEHSAKDPNTPQSVLTFIRYLRSTGE